MESENKLLPSLEGEAGFRALLEAAPDAILAVNDRGQIVLVNGQTERLFGYARLELLGHPLEMLLPERARQVHAQHRQGYFAKPQFRMMGTGSKYRGRRKDGLEFPVDVNLSPVETAQGMFYLSAIRDFSASREVEGERRAGEARFARIFQTAPASLVITTLEGRIVDANERILQALGYTRAEVVGHTIFELAFWVHPEHRARLLQKLREQGQVLNEEIAFRTRTGVERVGRASIEPIQVGGEPCLLSILEDITDRKEAERALWQAKELLETMFSSIDLMVAYLDRDLNFIRVNRAYAAADEHEPDFYVGRNHFALFPNAENEAIFRHAVETGEPYSVYAKPFEYTENPERGVTHWDWSLQPTKDPQGQVTGLVLSLVNVTDRIKAQEAFQQAAERLRFVVTSAPISIWAVDRMGIYTLVEGNLVASLGVKSGDLIGQSIWERSRSRPDVLYVITRAFSGEEVTADFEWLGRVMQTRYSPVKDSEGEVSGLIGVSIDITERRRADESLQEALRRLHGFAHETVLLQEEERRYIAHVLNDEAGQVLAAVRMNLESIQSTSPADPEILQQRVGMIIKEMRDTIAQIRSLAQDLRPPALDTAGLEVTLHGLCRTFAERSSLTIDYASSDVGVLDDAVCVSLYRFLQDTLSNIMQNTGAKLMQVRLEREDDTVHLTVQDDGEGFDPETISPSSDRMARVISGGRKRSGLLSIRERLKLLGGSLDIESQLGRGTRLSAHLPATFDPKSRPVTLQNPD